jgi:hypothetical protein
MVPASPPLVRENALPNNIPIHVDMVVMASPNTDRDLKFRRSSCDRPIRAMSRASVSVPVAVPVASTCTRLSECIGPLIAGLVVSVKPLLDCISYEAMAGWNRRNAVCHSEGRLHRNGLCWTRVRDELEIDSGKAKVEITEIKKASK